MPRLGPVLMELRRRVSDLRSPSLLIPRELRDLPVGLKFMPTGVTVDVLVSAEPGTATFDALNPVEFKPETIAGRIATGAIRLDLLNQLTSEDGDNLYVEAAAPVYPELDQSVPEAWGPGGVPAAGSNQGQGVIVGIVDTGVDITHPCFKDAAGQTRILRLWDQRLLAMPGEHPPTTPKPFTYGVEYLQPDIDAHLQALASGAPTSPGVRHLDRVGHGTFVAGIAAGNGSAVPPGKYIGVAPQADLVVVAVDAPATMLPTTRNLIDALDYVFLVAEDLGKRLVVNLSLGGWRGSHDGTGYVEEATNNLLTTNAERVLVKSAGNTGPSGQHAAVQMTTGATALLALLMPHAAGTVQVIEIWYPLGASIDCWVHDPSGTSSPPAGPTSHVRGTFGSDDYDIEHVVNSRDATGLNRIVIQLLTHTRALTPGTWTIYLQCTYSPSVAGTEAHAWIERARGQQPGFLNSSDQVTFTSPGAASEVIVVGAYSLGTAAGAFWPDGGRGPARDGSSICLLTAPGDPVWSSVPLYGGSRAYGQDSGTSLAAPHVTGAIALMLAADPSATRQRLVDCLQNTARSDAHTAAGPATGWGAGKLCIADALACIQNPDP